MRKYQRLVKSRILQLVDYMQVSLLDSLRSELVASVILALELVSENQKLKGANLENLF